MDPRVQLVFRGEVQPGHQLDDVKRRLGQLLKLDDVRLGQLFSGSRTVLKRSLLAEEAQRYVEHLTRIGARIVVEPMATPAPAIATPAMPLAPLAPLAISPGPAAAPTLALAPLDGAPSADEVTCPNCGERQTKRLLCRSCTTNIEMALAAKADDEQRAREEREARRAALRPRRPLPRGAIVDAVETDPDAPSIWGIGFSGRMARLPYATASGWLLSFLFVLTALALQKPGLGRILMLVLGALVIFGLSMRLAVLRCHDCDRHGWWALFLLVPYAGSLASLVLSFMPGTRGDNDYGGPARRGAWRWLAVALLALLLSAVWMGRSAIGLVERQSATLEDREDLAAPDEVDQWLRNPAAAAAFRSSYTLAQSNKAFAVSAGGAWGHASGLSSPRDAARAALSQCDEKREAYSPQCEVVNVNGQWPRVPQR